MGEVLTILSLITRVIPLLVNVAEVLLPEGGQGTLKKEFVLDLIPIVIKAFGSAKDLEVYEELKPHIGIMIDESVSIMNILVKRG